MLPVEEWVHNLQDPVCTAPLDILAVQFLWRHANWCGDFCECAESRECQKRQSYQHMHMEGQVEVLGAATIVVQEEGSHKLGNHILLRHLWFGLQDRKHEIVD